MIVALMGTNPYSFERLVKPLDALAEKNHLDVFMQLGNTKFEPRHCRFEHFIDHSRLLELIGESEMVITHGGFGSIKDALDLGKPIIAVPRQPQLKESQDYQEEMVRAFEEEGYVIGLYDIAKLESAINHAKTFKPAVRKGNLIPAILTEFLNNI